MRKVKHKSNKLKNGNKKVKALGNQIIADNWYIPYTTVYSKPVQC